MKRFKKYSVYELRSAIRDSFEEESLYKFAKKNKFKSIYPSRWTRDEINSFLDPLAENKKDMVLFSLGEEEKVETKKEKEVEEYELIEEETVANELGRDRIITHIDLKSQLSNYLERAIDIHLLKYTSEQSKLNAILVGDSGTGKTESALYLAMKRKNPVLLVSMTTDNSLKDFLIRRELENNSTVTLPGVFTDLLQRPSTIVLDELNMLPGKSLAKLHEIMNPGGRVYLPELDQVITRHRDCVIVSTMNQKSNKYSGTNELNVALLCRNQLVYIMPDFTEGEIQEITGCSKVEAEYFCSLRYQFKEERKRAVIDIRSIINFQKHKEMFGLRTAIGFFVDRLTVMDASVRDTVVALANQSLIE